ncbi:MAG: MarR family winged helix-turn-helix transcriptional regulator [Vulcanimicrobiaceae bacterium]
MVTEQVSRLIAKAYADRFELSVPEWRVIAHLGRSASLSATNLVERTAMDKVKVSRAVSNLSHRRIVRREVNPLDQRSTLLALTPAGRAMYEKIVPLALEMERAIFAQLPAADVEHLTRTLERIALQAGRLLKEIE